MTTEYEDTKVKSTSQKTGENIVKPQIHKPKKPVGPIFNDEKYGRKPNNKETVQQFQQEEQESSIWSKIIKALPLPLIGYLTALIAPKKIEAKNNSDKHAKDISSKFEGSSVEKASNKDHNRTK